MKAFKAFDSVVKEFAAQKMKFSLKDFFSRKLRIWSRLLKKTLMEKFTFCALPQF